MKLVYLYYQTDFAAQPALISNRTLNCTEHVVFLLDTDANATTYLQSKTNRLFLELMACDHIRTLLPATGQGKDQVTVYALLFLR